MREHRIEAVVVAIPSLPAWRSYEHASCATPRIRVRTCVSFPRSFPPWNGWSRRAICAPSGFSELLGRSECRVLAAVGASTLWPARTLLVTGAGGSIGQELCRQIRSHDPASLHMLDHDESNVHTLQLSSYGEALLDSSEVIIADIRDRTRIRQVFRSVRPDVVFHAAAHKHLPLLERHPCEGVKSNVLGTQNVVRGGAAKLGRRAASCLSPPTRRPIPRSILGATKRLAEMIV